MAILGAITINELSVLELDQSPIIDPVDAPDGSLALVTDGSAMFLKRPGGSANWQNLGTYTDNVKRVGMAGAPYTSIATAVTSCASPSVNNRYVILVEAGVYLEPEIVVPSYISIVGLDEKAVVVKSVGSNHVFKLTNPFVYISYLSIEAVPTGYAAIHAEDCGQYCIIHKVHINNCGQGINVLSTSGATRDTYLYTEYCDVEECVDPVNVVGQGSFLAYNQNENLYVGNYFTSVTTTEAVTVTGNAQYVHTAGTIENLHSPGTLVGVNFYDGAIVEISNTIINSWNIGVKSQNTGSAPHLTLRFVNLTNNNTDIDIQHTGTTGAISCFGDRSKLLIASNSLTLDLIDTSNPAQVTLGGFYTGKTYPTIADYAPAFRQQFSPGLIEGGVVSHSASSLTVNVTAGIGYVVVNENAADEFLKDVNFSAQSISVSANTESFLYIDSNGVLQKAVSQPSYTTNILLGSVISDSTGVWLNKNSQRSMHQNAADQEEMLRHVFQCLYAYGSIATEHTTARQVSVTAGEYYFGSNEYKPIGGTPITMQPLYRDGSGGFTKGTPLTSIATSSTTWKYDNNSGTLQNIPLLSYGNYRLYLLYEPNDNMETYFLTYPQSTHLSLTNARNEATPVLPTWFDAQIVRLADIIVQQGTANIIEINDKRPIFSTQASSVSSGGTTDHTSLTNLTTGDAGHTQFVMTDGSKPMTGALQIQAASNQLQLGTSVNQVTVNGGTSAAARTYVIPDVGISSTFAMLDGNQTINGIKTFSSNINLASELARGIAYTDASKNLKTVQLTNGQLLIGSTGNIPSAANITGTTNQVNVSNGAGTIVLSTPQDIATSSGVSFNTVTATGSDVNGNSFIASKGIKLGDTTVAEGSQVEGTVSYIGGTTQDLHLKNASFLRRIYSWRDLITTTSASTVTLSLSTANSYIFYGATPGQVVNLGDATTYDTGNKFRISNESSTLIRVVNAGGIKQEILYPGESVEFTVYDISTSNGLWLNDKHVASNKTVALFDDFISGNVTSNQVGALGWTGVASGTGTISVTAATALQEHGVITLARGTTSTNGYCSHLGLTSMQLGDGIIIYEARVKFPTLATVGQDYNFFLGLGNQSVAATEHTNGIYATYTRGTSGNWVFKTANNGTRTSVISSANISANTWYKITFIMNSAGTQVDFYVDDVFYNSITTNIPTVVGRTLGPNFKLQGVAGTTSVTAVIDYFKLIKIFNTMR